ncbi:MAG TPA: histidine phosphatase family protein, partial [Acidimicrobiales bacterium]|nr:histidine phosphatase family protein [Acidimicrobiales bacterium]
MPKTRRLYLLRHAKSSWGEPNLEDRARPLAPRGLKAAKDVGDHMRKGTIAPALVLCSTALRARQTLEALRLPGEASYEDSLYGASAADLMARLRRLPATLGSVMLVGHNPGLQELAVSLVGKGDP